MNHNYIILKFINITLYYFITLLHYIYYNLHLFYYLFTIYSKVTMVRLNWRGLDCGNEKTLEERLVRESDGNIIQGLFSSVQHFL